MLLLLLPAQILLHNSATTVLTFQPLSHDQLACKEVEVELQHKVVTLMKRTATLFTSNANAVHPRVAAAYAANSPCMRHRLSYGDTQAQSWWRTHMVGGITYTYYVAIFPIDEAL